MMTSLFYSLLRIFKAAALPAVMLAGLFFIAGCQKQEQAVRCDCDKLHQGLQTGNKNMVGQEINSLSADLLPQPTATDTYGQKDNIYLLAQRIGGQCGLKAEVLHYNGIKTLPMQSEIRVSDGSAFSLILDIGYNQQNRMIFLNMHP